jgi:hypothetical protein
VYVRIVNLAVDVEARATRDATIKADCSFAKRSQRGERRGSSFSQSYTQGCNAGLIVAVMRYGRTSPCR